MILVSFDFSLIWKKMQSIIIPVWNENWAKSPRHYSILVYHRPLHWPITFCRRAPVNGSQDQWPVFATQYTVMNFLVSIFVPLAQCYTDGCCGKPPHFDLQRWTTDWHNSWRCTRRMLQALCVVRWLRSVVFCFIFVTVSSADLPTQDFAVVRLPETCKKSIPGDLAEREEKWPQVFGARRTCASGAVEMVPSAPAATRATLCGLEGKARSWHL
jgi:hypothetical protein